VAPEPAGCASVRPDRLTCSADNSDRILDSSRYSLKKRIFITRNYLLGIRVPGVDVYVHRVHARAAVDSVARWSGGNDAVTAPTARKKKKEKVWTPQLSDSNIPPSSGCRLIMPLIVSMALLQFLFVVVV
jgi:hypothetical protein